MKKFLFLFVFTMFIVNAYAQNPLYLISQQGTVTDCAGDFYDSGGAGSPYGANQNLVITFNSSSLTNDHIKMTFNSFDVDPGDTLICYDGPNTASPVIGKYNNNNLPPNFVDATIYNPSGDLTFQFKSNGALQNSGWFGSLVCEPACQKIIADFDNNLTIPHPNDSNYVDICIGNPITFAANVGAVSFPQNDTLYHQDPSTSTYSWDFGDGTTGTGPVVSHTYTFVRGYDVSLTITDVRGCFNSNYLGGRVRISTNPIAEVHAVPDICSSSDTTYMTLGYNINSVVVVAPINSIQSSSQRYDSVTFIPDGPNCPPGSYNTYVTFTQFLPGQTITSANDVLSICVDIEHSFAGDLGFSIICPNGQQVILDGNDHSGGAYLGQANDTDGTPACDPSANAPGIPWVYCWSQIYTQQGYLNTLDAGTSPIPATDTIAHTNYFTPDASLSGLIGCPLNGTWNIQITDNWGIDNGYVFWWSLNLDPSLLPGGWSYQVPIDTVIWSGSFLHIINDTTVMVIPNASGTYPYTVTVIDAYGCSYDTTLNIQVVQTPDPNLGHDTTLCGNNINYMLDAGAGDIYSWSTGNVNQTQPVTTTGFYSVVVQNQNQAQTLTCTGTDTVFVRVLSLPAPVDLGPDICSTIPVTLDAGNPVGYQFQWSTNNPGDTTQTITAPVTGLYSVTVAEEFGYNCGQTDSIQVTIYPEPTITIGEDTSMCSYAKMHMHVADANGYLDNPLYHYTYAWFQNNISIGQTSRDILVECLTPDQAYTYKAEVTGCTTVSDERIINSINCALVLPNIITPDGNGLNDVLKITGIENFPGSNLKVFNRWGKKIFESDDYNNSDHAWDGGKEADGVYYYVLTINYGDHGDCVDTKDFNGTVTIIR
ncbi:MAG: gliding motility-associated C-terminal domain-containing protein [Bacteroidota bacterium]